MHVLDLKNYKLFESYKIILILILDLISIGPLIYKDNSTGTKVFRIIAVVSWGFGCAQEGHPGYYAPVFPQLDWIKSIMKETEKCPRDENKQNLATCSSSIASISYFLHYIVMLILFL